MYLLGYRARADAVGEPGPPPVSFATDTATALTTAATQAMAAIAESLTKGPANNSRARDGDIVIYQDISRVFDKVPVELLDRVKYRGMYKAL